jgi:hypothetical protein
MLKTKQKLLNRKSEGDGEPEFTIQNGHDRLTLKVYIAALGHKTWKPGYDHPNTST